MVAQCNTHLLSVIQRSLVFKGVVFFFFFAVPCGWLRWLLILFSFFFFLQKRNTKVARCASYSSLKKEPFFALFTPQKHMKNELLASFYFFFFSSLPEFFLQCFAERRKKKKKT